MFKFKSDRNLYFINVPEHLFVKDLLEWSPASIDDLCVANQIILISEKRKARCIKNRYGIAAMPSQYIDDELQKIETINDALLNIKHRNFVIRDYCKFRLTKTKDCVYIDEKD